MKQKPIASWLPDISIILGVIMLAAGLYFIYKPLALITPGIFLIYAGWPAGKKAK